MRVMALAQGTVMFPRHVLSSSVHDDENTWQSRVIRFDPIERVDPAVDPEPDRLTEALQIPMSQRSFDPFKPQPARVHHFCHRIPLTYPSLARRAMSSKRAPLYATFAAVRSGTKRAQERTTAAWAPRHRAQPTTIAEGSGMPVVTGLSEWCGRGDSTPTVLLPPAPQAGKD